MNMPKKGKLELIVEDDEQDTLVLLKAAVAWTLTIDVLLVDIPKNGNIELVV
jgi:hypothetical protein